MVLTCEASYVGKNPLRISLILRAPSLGTNFAYFYATGFLPFFFYMQISQLMATSLRFSRPLLEYPAVTFLDALVARFILNALTHMLVFVVVMAGIIIIYDLRPILDWQAIFMAMAMIVALTIGVGVINCYLISMYQVWERVWSVINRPMFIISGVIFIPENVPERYRDLMMLNPLAHPISEMRKGFFPTYEASHVSTLYPFMVAMVLTVLGLFILYFHHRQILTR
jgi:capsular polysaccharide transport system permease protein